MCKKKKIGFGIIGTGAIAGVHAKCIKQIQNAELIAMSGSSADRAKTAANRYHVQVYDDYIKLLKIKDIDIVCICTQSGEHLKPTIEAALAGKHVLSEKPLEITVERADKMIDICKKQGVKLGCVFQNRFSQGFIALKQAVDDGKLGKLLMGKASINWHRKESYYTDSPWRGTIKGDGGAALINQGIHTIDLLMSIMGNAKSVFGKVNTVVHKIEGEDIANAIVEFKNGAMGNITAGTSLYPGYPERLEIYGEKGSVILVAGNIVDWNVKGESRNMNTEDKKGKSGSSDPMAIANYLHKAQISNMIEAVINNTEPLINGEEGRKSIELIQAIYKSSKQQREILL